MSQNAPEDPNMERTQETVRISAFQAMGLNDTLDFLGTQLHVQTETTGLPFPRIVTQVFSKGRIVFSKKTEYPADIHNTGTTEKINELMRIHHFQVIEDIADKQKRIQNDRTP